MFINVPQVYEISLILCLFYAFYEQSLLCDYLSTYEETISTVVRILTACVDIIVIQWQFTVFLENEGLVVLYFWQMPSSHV